jgi:hypothetical protein
MNMRTNIPWSRRPVRLFIGFLTVLWLTLIGAHLFGFRIVRPNLESAADRAAYGQSYTHK